MKRILFVDDEQRILEGLQDLLRRHRSKWTMVFAHGAAAGLEEVEKSEPFDVVISDMRMPGMDGAALLERVREKNAGTLRVILSGYSDLTGTLKLVTVAHRFLAKPCDGAALVAAIEGVDDEGTRDRIHVMVGSMRVPPTAPKAWPRLAAMLGEPSCNAERIAAELERDPGLALKVLQLVNSAFFGLPRSIASLERAVSYLGQATLLATVLAVEAFGTLSGLSPALVSEVRRHGVMAGRIARKLRPDVPDDAYIAAMLQDIGRLVLAAGEPEAYARVCDPGRRGSLVEAEFEEFGVSHAQVGAYLLATWGLAKPISDAVASSHTPIPGGPWDLKATTCAAGALAEWAVRPTDATPPDALALRVPSQFPHWRDIASAVAVSET